VDKIVLMRIIKPAKLAEFCAHHASCKEPLLRWYGIAGISNWTSFVEMRSVFRDADEVVVKSGKKAVVFNIKRNDYRLITAVHYTKTVRDAEGNSKVIEGRIYLFYLLTHAEYDKELWKRRL
jgi:mRNA interferase HigB